MNSEKNNIRDFDSAWRPVELILLFYFSATLLPLLLFHKRLEHSLYFILLHLGLIGFLVWVQRHQRMNSLKLSLLRRIYPLFSAPFLYWEVAYLNDLIFPNTYFDSWVVIWEEFLFLGQPSVTLRNLFPWTWLSEYLHFCYFIYYALGISLWIRLARASKWEQIEKAYTALALVFFVCNLFFIFFPVAGPYHHFDRPNPYQLGDFFPPLVHRVLDAGSSVGAAFPSNHVAVAWVLLWLAYRYDRILFWIFLTIVPALIVSTVYGGFHYAVDALAGLMLGAIVLRSYERIHSQIAKHTPVKRR